MQLSELQTTAAVSFNTVAIRNFDAIAEEQRKQDYEARLMADRELPMPDLSPFSASTVPTKFLVASLSDIDDIGYVLVGKQDGSWTTAIWTEWKAFSAGDGQVDLARVLGQGKNYIIFGVHNKALLGRPGRWGSSFRLDSDSAVLWRQAGGGADAGVGTRYWKVLMASKDKFGNILIAAAKPDEIAAVFSRMKRFNERMIENFEHETSVLSTVVAGLIVDVLTGPPQSSVSSSCAVNDNACIQFRDWAARRERAWEWAGQVQGRSPDDYRGN